MSTKYCIKEPQSPYFLTLTLVEWIDLFSHEKYKELIIENLKFYMHKGLKLHTYVIMTNHIHLIASVDEGKNLVSIIKDFKSYTTRIIYDDLKANKCESRRNWLICIMETQGRRSSSNVKLKLWKHENHAVLLSNNSILDQRLNDIHQNPVKAGICYRPEDYKYSSAGIYSGGEGVLEVCSIRPYLGTT